MRIFFSADQSATGQISVAGASANSFTLAELADGQVVYKHDGSEPGSTEATTSFNFSLSDGQSESSPVLLTISIESTNDLPVLNFVPAAQAVTENTPGQVVGQIEYTDADAADTVEFSVNDPRFVLTPIDANTVQVSLGVDDALDYEADVDLDTGTMQLQITAIDSNPAFARPLDYQGTQATAYFPVEDINDAPVIDTESVLTVVPGEGYVFDGSWVEDQDDSINELEFSAVLTDGSVLPSWLQFNPENRTFEVLDPESPALDDVDIIISVVDSAGESISVPVSLLFEPLTDPAPAESVVEPVVAPAEPVPEPGPEDALEAQLPELVDLIPEPVFDLNELVAPPPQIAEGLPERPETARTERAVGVAGSERAVSDELYEKVNLHDLIKPLTSIGTLQLAVLDTANSGSSESSLGSQIAENMDTRDLNELFKAAQAEFEAQSALMAIAFDNKQVAQDSRTATSRAIFGTTTGVSAGLSVGYLFWLVRGGTLMGSVLSSLPAWRFVDPLPVLGSLADDMENDDETLESIVENEGKG